MRFAFVAIALLAAAVNANEAEDAMMMDMMQGSSNGEFEDFKDQFGMHGSALLEQEAELASESERAQILAELDQGEAEVKAAEQNVARLEKTVEMMEKAEEANSMEARVAAVMAVSAKIDTLVDDAIMEYLLNPSTDVVPASFVQTPIDDASFMNHRIVKLMGLEAPAKEIQEILSDKVLKGLEKDGKIAIASINLDSLKHDAQVEMNLQCLMSLAKDPQQKLFIDVHGDTPERRNRVKIMVKMFDTDAQPLDMMKNFQAEDYTYKLADSIYKLGDFEKATASAAKQQELMSSRASKVLADAKLPKGEMCTLDKKVADKQNKQLESMFAHKPYFGQSNLIKKSKEAKNAETQQGPAPSQRRASFTS